MYCDVKVKIIFKRRSKVLETVKRETNGTSEGLADGSTGRRIGESSVTRRP
jgi:hypothetical protein